VVGPRLGQAWETSSNAEGSDSAPSHARVRRARARGAKKIRDVSMPIRWLELSGRSLFNGISHTGRV